MEDRKKCLILCNHAWLRLIMYYLGNNMGNFPAEANILLHLLRKMV